MKTSISILISILFLSCVHHRESHLNFHTQGISGMDEFKTTPYITAGDRVYAIGAQNGGFPEIGWHIDKEMGGIWNHPIKLLDGFKAHITASSKTTELKDAQFTNYPHGNAFLYDLSDLGLSVDRVQFAPDQKQGLVVGYSISNLNPTPFEGTLSFEAAFDLRPTWLGERTEMIDGDDMVSFDASQNCILAKDQNNDWFSAVGCSEPIQGFESLESSYKGKGRSARMDLPLEIDKKGTKTIYLFISGSYKDQAETIAELEALRSGFPELLSKKQRRFEDIENQARLTTSDPEFDLVYKWLKYNSEWFIREVPEIGRGIAAGYPDYPWWFGCDTEFALKGYVSIGQFDIAKYSIDLIAKLSRDTNTNGRIIHEASTNGVVFNPGNMNETPQFASLVWETYLWTGDKTLLSNNFDLVKRGLDWISTERDHDQNGFPEGAGMMEIHGLESEMIDVATYTQSGFRDAAKIAEAFGESELSSVYLNKAMDLKDKINEVLWVEEFNSFADFMATDEETLSLIEDAIIRADTLNKPWAVEELLETKDYILDHPSDAVRPFVLHHNWVVNTPLETGIADAQKAKQALKTARKFVNPYGVFVTGIDRDASAGKEIGSFKGSKVFSYTGAVMTLPTGVSAVAENNYGNPDQALDYLKRMGRSFSFALPGSIYEVSPDYGMFAQAWNLYSYAVPVVQQFFGITPRAFEKQITISPLMPSAWESAKLENVRVGDNHISIAYSKTESGYTIRIQSEQPGWRILFETKEGQEVISEEVLEPNTTVYTVRKLSD
ncbi:glucosidase family protein [Aestuariivivens sediminicola]|uniref:glycogen debranching protein n=1 Tax=Aestuariivivens sediminicola TaxID=2913560 RepID=UPI001F55C542|nr:glycogen debranching protein [Aestuariivivens sediminicola]